MPREVHENKNVSTVSIYVRALAVSSSVIPVLLLSLQWVALPIFLFAELRDSDEAFFLLCVAVSLGVGIPASVTTSVIMLCVKGRDNKPYVNDAKFGLLLNLMIYLNLLIAAIWIRIFNLSDGFMRWSWCLLGIGAILSEVWLVFCVRKKISHPKTRSRHQPDKSSMSGHRFRRYLPVAGLVIVGLAGLLLHVYGFDSGLLVLVIGSLVFGADFLAHRVESRALSRLGSAILMITGFVLLTIAVYVALMAASFFGSGPDSKFSIGPMALGIGFAVGFCVSLLGIGFLVLANNAWQAKNHPHHSESL